MATNLYDIQLTKRLAEKLKVNIYLCVQNKEITGPSQVSAAAFNDF